MTDTVTGISRDVKAAVTEGRSAMREREAELRKPRAARTTRLEPVRSHHPGSVAWQSPWLP